MVKEENSNIISLYEIIGSILYGVALFLISPTSFKSSKI